MHGHHREEVPTKLQLLRAAALIAAIALSQCGGGGYSNTTPTSPSPATTPTAGTPVTITIRSQNGNQSFSPNPASAGGQQVVFKNADTIVHRVVLNDGTVDTGDIAPGATSRTVTMPSSGATYHCLLHPTMVGAVTTASGGAPPPCTSNCGGSGDDGNPPAYY